MRSSAPVEIDAQIFGEEPLVDLPRRYDVPRVQPAEQRPVLGIVVQSRRVVTGLDFRIGKRKPSEDLADVVVRQDIVDLIQD